MAIALKDILKADDYKKLSSASIASIEASINESLDTKKSELEQNNTTKFESLISDLNRKFNEKVDTAVIESVKSGASDVVNTNLYNIVKGIANLLENSGIIMTEKTKELQRALEDADKRVEESYKAREEIKEDLNTELKKNLIMTKLQGMRPEVVKGALDFFMTKDIREIDDDAIQSFLDGDLTDLVADAMDDENFHGEDINLDQVHDALDEINTGRKERERSSVFESKLGKGLKHRHVKSSPNVSMKDLNDASVLTEGAYGDNSDAMDTLSKIEDFRGLGYNFQ